MPDDIRENVRRRDTWVRIFFMLVFGFIYGVTNAVVGAVAVLQAGWTLVTTRPNPELRRLGAMLGNYVRQIVTFLTFGSDQMPFPFSAWPGPGIGDLPDPGHGREDDRGVPSP